MTSAQFTIDRLYTKDLYVNGAQISHPTLASLLTVSNNVGINNNDPKVKLDINGTDGLRIPVGTTVQVPVIGANGVTDLSGVMRYNTTKNQYEAWALGGWQAFGGSKLELYTKEQGNNPTIKLTKIVNTYGGNDDGTSIEFDLRNQAGSHTYQAKIYAIDSSSDSGKGSLRFQTANGGSYQDRMTVYHDGNVGIGTTVPKSKLDIVGDISAVNINISGDISANDISANDASFNVVEATKFIGELLGNATTVTNGVYTTDGSTGAIKLPAGTEAQRPSTAVPGQIRYNNTDDQFEGYGTEWGSLGGGSGSNMKLSQSSTNVINNVQSQSNFNNLISCGLEHTAILLNTGRVLTFGGGLYGKLGNNQTSNQLTPVDVSANNGYDGTNAIAVSCGWNYTAILLNTGRVLTFGYGNYGQLGDGYTSDRSIPVKVTATNGYDGTNAIAVSCGGNHTVILLNTGRVLTFGYGGSGRLGNNQTSNQLTPVDVSATNGYDGTNAIAVYCGINHTAILLNTGRVLTFGEADNGRLGDGYTSDRSTPVDVSANNGYDGTNAIAVSCGSNHTAILLNTGRVLTFGEALYGRLGNNNKVDDQHTPVDVSANNGYDGTNAIAVSCGVHHTAMLLNTGRVLTFGYGYYGRLGNGNIYENDTAIPQDVSANNGYDGTNAIAVSCRGEYTAILLNTGRVLTFGYNNVGQLGTGGTSQSGIPVDVSANNGYDQTNVYNDINSLSFSTGFLRAGDLLIGDKGKLDISGVMDSSSGVANGVIQLSTISDISAAHCLIGTQYEDISKCGMVLYSGGQSKTWDTSPVWQDITWGTTNNVSVASNYILMTSGGPSWGSIATSQQLIYQNNSEIQKIKFQRHILNSASLTESYGMVGLTKNNITVDHYGDINYVLYLRKNEHLRVLETATQGTSYNEKFSTTSSSVISTSTSIWYEIHVIPAALNSSSNDIIEYWAGVEGSLTKQYTSTMAVNNFYPLKITFCFDGDEASTVNTGIKNAQILTSTTGTNTHNHKMNLISNSYNFNVTATTPAKGKHGYEALKDIVDKIDNTDSAFYINSSKQVGIKTMTPSASATLDVNGSVYASGSQLTSDDRIKHNEQTITNALNIIQQLTPKHYFKTKELYDASHNFTLDASGNPLSTAGVPLVLHKDYTLETGIIAQEIEQIAPLQFTVTRGNNSFYVDYNSIHCTHIASTKELHQITLIEQAKLAAAEQEIATLKTQLAAVLARLDALENP